jgi:transcriptional regulator with XRE-family HTH domain
MPPLPLLLQRLGQIIRTLRIQAGYSQERFGFAIGVHRTYMGHLERGTANPTMKTLHLVAEGLGLNVSDLLTQAAVENSLDNRSALATGPCQDPARQPAAKRPGPAPGSPKIGPKAAEGRRGRSRSGKVRDK